MIRLYRALLILYPRRFRDDYGELMVQAFGDRLRDSGDGIWRSTIPDLIRSVPIERGDAVMARLQSSGSRVLTIAVAVAGAVVMVIGTGGRGVALVIAAALIGLFVVQWRVVRSVTRGERAPLRYAATQSWWAPIATLLGVATILFGIGTIFEAHNWGGRIVGAGLLLAVGSAMLIGLKRRPFDRSGGNATILIATIPALLFFWMIIPPLVAIVIWVGVLSDGAAPQPVVADS